MLAKRLLFVSAGILCLALAYQFGATAATAQAPSNPVVGITEVNGGESDITANGDAYFTNTGGATWELRGNLFGAPTPAAQQSWGQVKARYR